MGFLCVLWLLLLHRPICFHILQGGSPLSKDNIVGIKSTLYIGFRFFGADDFYIAPDVITFQKLLGRMNKEVVYYWI